LLHEKGIYEGATEKVEATTEKGRRREERREVEARGEGH